MKKRISQRVLLILVILVLFAIGSGYKRGLVFVDTSAYAETDVSTLECNQTGEASWYGNNMKGELTASGDKFDPEAMTAASRKLPLGTKVNIINLKNDQNVTVTVNDRGPYSGNRIIDVSAAAAKELDMKKSGLAPVCVQNTQQGKVSVDSGKRQ